MCVCVVLCRGANGMNEIQILCIIATFKIENFQHKGNIISIFREIS